jgi:hypothetical protein
MRKVLLAVAVLTGLAGASLARTVEQQVLGSLAAQGYVILEQGYTFLGRLRIVAENDRFHREIVVNPGTGEILRDYAVKLPRGTTPAAPPSADSPAVAFAAPALAGTAAAGRDGTPNPDARAGVSASMQEDDATPFGVTNIFQVPEDEFGTDTGPIELVLPESILQMDPEAP